MTGAITPFTTFILKIASHCNLNCTYCFVYNKADQRWRLQPKLMSISVARKIAERIIEHCKSNGMFNTVEIIFHGGEPLLGGIKHLSALIGTIEEVFSESGVPIRIAMQSNGLLFDEEIGDLLLSKHATVGVSIDGPPDVNDQFRIDRRGRGTSARLEKKLASLTSDKYRPLFSGFLVVVNPGTDPIRLMDYLMAYRPPSVDFLLPYDNHVNMPPLKTTFLDDVYGEWLVKAFDYWYLNNMNASVRMFNSIMRLLLGGKSLVESLGAGVVKLIVIETNGAIEAVDALKASFDGATDLSLNVFDHRFDDAARHAHVRARQTGAVGLSEYCRRCAIVDICGGGYLPNRYSVENGFDNPSVYCKDLSKLIYHIHGRMSESFRRLDE